MGRRIYVFDTTLRDGEQSPGASLTAQEKIEIAKQLARLKVDVIEAGFPVASPGDFAAVRAIAEEVEGPVVAALARTTRADIERAVEALRPARRPRVHTFIATSEIHMRHKLRKTPEEVVRMAVEAVRLARKWVEDVEFSAEDATRSDPDFLCRIFAAAIEAGATVVNVPDTVGYTTPAEYAELIRYIKARTPGIDRVRISVHCHNDLGLAVANSLAALDAGADQVECTINGIGERAGNAALEEIVMAIRTRSDRYPLQTGIVTEQLYRTSRMVSAMTGLPVQPNKAIVGDNAFAHEAGIHQDGILKERTTYEIMTPQSVGLPQSRLVLGKHSGRHAFRKRLEEMGYHLPEAEMERAYQRFLDLADRKKSVSERDLQAIVEEGLSSAPELYQLVYLQVTTGNATVSTATVRLRRAEVLYQEAACGDGPVDAVYRAIDRVTGLKTELESYSLNAVTAGKDALGEVTVRIRDNGNTYVGRGTSVDVIEASAKAYIQAVNKLAFDRHSPGAAASARIVLEEKAGAAAQASAAAS